MNFFNFIFTIVLLQYPGTVMIYISYYDTVPRTSMILYMYCISICTYHIIIDFIIFVSYHNVKCNT